jgi:hypothetical protein
MRLAGPLSPVILTTVMRLLSVLKSSHDVPTFSKVATVRLLPIPADLSRAAISMAVPEPSICQTALPIVRATLSGASVLLHLPGPPQSCDAGNCKGAFWTNSQTHNAQISSLDASVRRHRILAGLLRAVISMDALASSTYQTVKPIAQRTLSGASALLHPKLVGHHRAAIRTTATAGFEETFHICSATTSSMYASAQRHRTLADRLRVRIIGFLYSLSRIRRHSAFISCILKTS